MTKSTEMNKAFMITTKRTICIYTYKQTNIFNVLVIIYKEPSINNALQLCKKDFVKNFCIMTASEVI